MVNNVVWLPGWSFGAEISARSGIDCENVCDFSTCNNETDFVTHAHEAVAKMQGPVVIVGWSLGSMVALELAALFPERITKLCLIGATGCFVGADGQTSRVVERMRSKLVASSDAVVANFDRRIGLSIERNQPWSPEALAAGLDYLLHRSLFETAQNIAAPVALLHGSEDPIVPIAAAEQLATALPHANLTIWEGEGHAPFHTRPADFVKWLEDNSK